MNKFNMKKIYFLFAFSLSILSAVAQGSLAKGENQLNAGIGFSSFGVPLYVGADFGIHESITIGPRISYRKYSEKYIGNKYSQSLTVISFNGNYHFNTLLNLQAPWDVYAGITLGYYLWSDIKWNNGSTTSFGGEASGIGFDAQVGARYFFNDQLAFNLEFGGGTGSGGIFGVTYRF
jgi:outer membrane immunogenic protein